jgi:hypothetical protein
MKDNVNMWGPAIIVCLTVLVGVITNNKRIDDLRASLTGQINDLRSDLVARIEGLEKRVIDRIERLERPVLKP